MILKLYLIPIVSFLLGLESAMAASTAPIAPASLTATAVSATQINLQWQDRSSNEQGFIIQRSLSSTSGFVQIASMSAGSVNFSSTSLSPATTYYYRVAAYSKVRGQYVYSSFSNVASATTLSVSSTTTTVPPTTTTVPVTANSISLSVAGAPNLPYNGTSTLVTVGFSGATPAQVTLSRDGLAAFATWPGGTFFTLSSDGKSISGQWCISASCWGYQAGTHVLTAVATYADGSTKSSSVTLNVVDSTVTTTTLPSPTTTTLPSPTTTTTTMVSSSGPTYYVSPAGNDFNAGTASAPWRTIQKAADSVSAGATVILMDGTYEEGQIQMKRGGTASAPVTFKAQNKWMAVVSSISGCNPGISVYSSYITLQDFRMNVSPRNVNCTIYTSANVHVRAWNSTVSTISNPGTGYVGFHATGLKVDPASNRAEGIKSNQDFTVIENLDMNGSVELFATLNSHIRNNVFWGQGPSLISIFAKGGVRNTQIYNNIIHNKVSGGLGIILGGSSCDTCHFDDSTSIEAYNIVAYNNVILNESGGPMTAFAYQGPTDSGFINNIAIGGTIAMYEGGNTIRSSTNNPIFKNNIMVCNGGSASSGIRYTGTMMMDYNNFYNCSWAPSQAHPIVGNPMFVDQLSDWHLQAGSPAINTGTPTPSFAGYAGSVIDISRDFNGVVRSSPWDLGIYNTP